MRGGVFFLFAVFCFNAQAQFKNVRLSNVEASYPVAPSVIINAKNPDHIIAGIANTTFYSADAGTTWTESKLTSSFGVEGNVLLLADSKGRAYLFHSTNGAGQGQSNDAYMDRIGIQESEDGGKTWLETGAIATNVAKDHAYPRVAIHPRKQTWYATWTQFDRYGLKDVACQSHILFSKSGSSGKKWSAPLQLSRNPGDCTDSEETPGGATPVVGMDDKMFAVWSNQGTIYFDRSYDGGDTWLGDDVALTKQAGGWQMPVPGVGESNGMPLLLIDNSTSPYHGSIYIVWADQKSGKDDTDIWMIRTHNRGDNWTAPLRINQDSVGHHQFMPWAVIDQITGHLYVVYYDRRAHDDQQTDVYLAYSVDGGSSFKEKQISENSFTPEEKVFSIHNGIAAHKGVIVPVWTRTDGGKISVWTTTIKESDLLKMK